MGAADVVGKDLELRVGVDDRVVGQHEIAVGLFGVGLLRILVDDDAAVEDRPRRSAENALVKLKAVAVGLCMPHRDVGVRLLFAIGDVEAVEGCNGCFAVENDVDIRSGENAAKRYRLTGVAAGRGELDLAHREVAGL